MSSYLPGALVDRSRLVRDIALGTVAVGLECIWTDDPNQPDRLLLKCYAIVAVLKRGIVFVCRFVCRSLLARLECDATEGSQIESLVERLLMSPRGRVCLARYLARYFRFETEYFV